MLRLTDHVGLFVVLPSYVNMRENITIFSTMMPDQFRDKLITIPQMVSYYLAGRPLRDTADGFYPMKFCVASLMTYFATLFDGILPQPILLNLYYPTLSGDLCPKMDTYLHP